MGAEKQAKVKGQAGDQKGKRPPPGSGKARSAGEAKDKPPQRHLFAQPRGRGPSQTPPSLATDSSISPGPPSPWLPAPPIEWLFYRFCAELAMPKASPCRMPDWQVEPVSPGQAPPLGTCLASSVSAANGLMQGCRGLRPRQNKLKVSPFPAGEGGWGDRGQNNKPKAG